MRGRKSLGLTPSGFATRTTTGTTATSVASCSETKRSRSRTLPNQMKNHLTTYSRRPMKVNVFVSTRSGGNFAGSFPHSSITGEQVDGPEAPEDSIIAAIDEDRISPEKALAVRFLTFLGNHRLTIES